MTARHISDKDPAHEQLQQLVILAVVLTILVAFILDTLLPLGVATPVLYIMAVVASLGTGDERAPLLVGIAAIPLIVIGHYGSLGYFTSPSGAESLGMANRFLSIIAIGTVAATSTYYVRADSALRRLNIGLDNEVTQRTEELWIANGSLAFEVEQRETAERALQSEKDKLEVTLKSIGEGVIVVDCLQKIMMINSVAEQLTGWKFSEAEGKDFDEVLRIEDEETGVECENLASMSLKTGKIEDLPNHAILVSRDGTRRRIDTSGAPVVMETGQTLGVIIIFRDITTQIRMEEDIATAKKLESVGLLAGGIAHDFNNILTAIEGNISLALASARSRKGVVKRLLEAEKACVRARTLSRQLLTFAKGGEPVKAVLPVPEILEDTTSLALSGSSIRPMFSVDEDIWSIEADEGQISQVIANIVMNAKESMPNGGDIIISAENVELQCDSSTLKAGPHVKIAIKDRGVGIPPENLSRIFEPYFTTKPSGKGLGLTIAYSIVKKHNGHIEVDSEVGRGSDFHIYLPASEKRIDHEVEEVTEHVYGSGKILWMDDEEGIRDVGEAILSSHGYEVEFAVNGDDAIQLHKKALAAGNPYDALILDLTIVGGMGGKEAIVRIMEADPEVNAIVCSGYSNDPVMADYKQYGFNGVLPKPFNIEELLRVLDVTMRDKATRHCRSHAPAELAG
jgi:two-component system cell cycle sensor histidine kinase/response regulator CckA